MTSLYTLYKGKIVSITFDKRAEVRYANVITKIEEIDGHLIRVGLMMGYNPAFMGMYYAAVDKFLHLEKIKNEGGKDIIEKLKKAGFNKDEPLESILNDQAIAICSPVTIQET